MNPEMLSESRSVAPAISEDGRPRFRRDIEGLRAVAVLLVILFHASVPGFQGGYVGVDIFFVISGFLIIDTLYREASTTSTVRLSRFWARRIRRLVPALSAMVIATWAAGLMIQSPLEWNDLGQQGASAATYTSNLLFARQSGGYFANGESPFLHTWSLSVEEQFYIGWPILMLIAAKAVGRWGRLGRRQTLGLIAAVTLVSFALSVVLTNRGTPWAYFSAPTRAWEFGLGGLLALSGVWLARLRPWHANVLFVAGLVAILFSAIQFNELTAFPGFLAAVPVLGAVLVLLAGTQKAAVLPARTLGLPLLQLIGRLSYSWYLWHWPILIMAARLHGPLSVYEKLALSTVALAIAGLSYRFIEQPVRHSRWLENTTRAISLGLASVVILVLCSVGITQAANRELSEPYLAALVAARDGRSDGGDGDCAVTALNGNEYCLYGPDDASKLVVLVGDSHAAQWAPAVIDAATANRSRVLVRTYGGCPAFDVPVRATGKATVSTGCTEFRAETMRLIADLEPDVVVMSNADYTPRLLHLESDGGLLEREPAISTWARAAADFASTLQAQQTPLVVIANNPTMPEDPIDCLARHRDAARCAAPSAPLLAELEKVRGPEQQALESVGVAGVLDPTPLICDEDLCQVIDESGPIFSDANHLATGFVLTFVDPLVELLEAAL